MKRLYTNIDWDVYNELGRPELTIDRYSTGQIDVDAVSRRVLVTQDSGLTEFAVGIADGFNLSEIVIDPSLPIRDGPLGSEPGFGAIVFSQFDIIPMSREDILGEWGMNVILPGAIDECSTDNGAERRCGVILRFNDTGVGYAGDRAFEWTATEFGAIAIEMADGVRLPQARQRYVNTTMARSLHCRRPQRVVTHSFSKVTRREA